MNKRDDEIVENSQEFQYMESNFDSMMQEMEEDSKTNDFSIPDDWDVQFRRAIKETLERKKREEEQRKKARQKMLAMAAGIVLVLFLGTNFTLEAVQGDSLLDVFKNKFQEDSEYTAYGTEELVMDEEEQNLTICLEGDTLTEVYQHLKEEVKRPIFQIKDDIDEYEICSASYNTLFRMVIIDMEFPDGRIQLSQEEKVENSATAVKNEKKECAKIWNENLQEYILIYEGIQDDSYTWSVDRDYAIFYFNGYISLEKCCQMAENLSFD